MPASETITERTGLLINEWVEEESVKEKQEFTRSLEYIYSHPWRALILNTLLPSAVFNRWVMNKNVYTIYSQYSKLGFNKKLKDALTQSAASKLLNEEECNFLKRLTYNPELNDLTSCETLYRIAKNEKLSLSNCKELDSIAEKLAEKDKNKTAIKAILDNPQLAKQVVDTLTIIINKYICLTDPEYKLLLRLSDKNSISIDEKNELADLVKKLNLNKQKHEHLYTLINKSSVFFSKNISVTREEQKALKKLANESLVQVDYENLKNFTQSMADKSTYTIKDRNEISKFALLKNLKKEDVTALRDLTRLSSYNSAQLKTLALNSAFSLSDHQLLMDITTQRKLTYQNSKKLADLAASSHLNPLSQSQLDSMVASAKNFKLAADFNPNQFFEDTLVRYFIEELQANYQGTAEKRYLSRRERRNLQELYAELDPLSTEAKDLKPFIHKHHLSARDSRQLAEKVIKNPDLSMEEYNDLRALADKDRLTKTDVAKLQEIINNKPKLREPLAIIVDKYKNRSFTVSDAVRDALINAAENSTLSIVGREKLKSIIENKQLSPEARRFLKNIKVNLNQISDYCTFERRLEWSKAKQNYLELDLDENRLARLHGELDNKLKGELSELQEFIYTQNLHEIKLQEKLAQKAKVEKAARIQQRSYKAAIQDTGKITTIAYASLTGFMAFVATAFAFIWIPHVGIPLAIAVGIGTAITNNQLNQSNLSTLLIDLFVKRNLFEHLSTKQRILLVILGIGCVLAGIGAGVLFYSVIAAHLAAVLAIVGIACPPLIPIIIGAVLAPLIGIMVAVTYFNVIREIIEHYSLNGFYNFLYKNFIQDVIDAETVAERVAHIAKGICLIAFGLGGVILAGAAAVIAALVLHEAAEPLLHTLIHTVIHAGHGISLHFVPAIKAAFLAVPATVAGIRFLATTEHFGKFTTMVSDFVKRATTKLLQPIQNYFSPSTQNTDLATPTTAKPSVFERVKNFFKQIPQKLEQAKDNPWSLAKPVEVVKKVAASGIIVLNGIGEGAVPEVVMNTTIEIAEVGAEAAIGGTSSVFAAAELLNSNAAKKYSKKEHKRFNAMRHSEFRNSFFGTNASRTNTEVSSPEQIDINHDSQLPTNLTFQ